MEPDERIVVAEPNKDSGIFVKRFEFDIAFERQVARSVDVAAGCRIDVQDIGFGGFQSGDDENILPNRVADNQLDRHRLEGGVHLVRQVYAVGMNRIKREVGRDANGVVDFELGRGIGLEFEGAFTLLALCGFVGFGGHARTAIDSENGVGTRHKIVNGIRCQVGDFHVDTILRDCHGVGEPECERIMSGRGLEQRIVHPIDPCGIRCEGVALRRTERADEGQRILRRGEDERETMLFFAIDATEIMALLVLGEVPKDEVGRFVGGLQGSADSVDEAREKGVEGDGVDAYGVAPKGVSQHLRGGGGHDESVGKGEVFAGLVEVVAADVVEGIEAIGARADIVDGEIAFFVAAADARERQGGEGGIVEVAVDADHNIGDGVEVLGVEYDARYLERVDVIAGGEREDIVAEGGLLIVVADSGSEIDGVGGGILQVLLEKLKKLQ